MGQYVELRVKIKSTNPNKELPDFGLGKGVLVTQLAQLDDDGGIASLQLINMGDALVKSVVEFVAIPITEKEYNTDPTVGVGFKIGDPVEIIGNIPYQLKDKPRPLLGKIIDIDGAYILVRPKYQRYECEFYRGEIKHI